MIGRFRQWRQRRRARKLELEADDQEVGFELLKIATEVAAATSLSDIQAVNLALPIAERILKDHEDDKAEVQNLIEGSK